MSDKLAKFTPRCPTSDDCPASASQTKSHCPKCGAILHHDFRGQVVAERYEVLELVGAGGMGLVYKARHIAMDRIVAIKVLPEGSANMIARFQREARALSQLNHANIVQVYDFGSLRSRDLFLVMEFLDGRPLSNLPTPDVEAKWVLELMVQVCAALEVAHELGIVHRDLKPDNIFVLSRGGAPDRVKVLDFGIAKVVNEPEDNADVNLTQAGRLCGTPHFMAPEQVRGQTVDGRTDVYALGVLIFQLLTQRRLFDGDSVQHILSKHVYEEPLPIRQVVPGAFYSAEFEALILRCLEKKPERRYQTIAKIKRELERFVLGALPIRDDRQESRSEDLTIDVDPGQIHMNLNRPFSLTPNSRSSAGEMMVVLPSAEERPYPKGKVLLVDDSLYLSNQLTEMLNADGFDVILGRNGLEGLEQLDLNSHVIMVVTDMNMPVMDGMEFLERIRRNLKTKDLPVMVLSAANDKALFDRASELGVFAWLVKPADPKTIVQAINQLVNQEGSPSQKETKE